MNVKFNVISTICLGVDPGLGVPNLTFTYLSNLKLPKFMPTMYETKLTAVKKSSINYTVGQVVATKPGMF